MHELLPSAGEYVELSCDVDWVADLLLESASGALLSPAAARATLSIRVERSRRPFPSAGWRVLTRGAWTRPGELVVLDVCTSGFDLHADLAADPPVFTYRWRPPARTHVAALALRSRFHLLARAALVQYPAMWWAGRRGCAPLHAPACRTPAGCLLLAGPGGVGKTTLLATELAAGGDAISDNLCVADGRSAWGVVEPQRVTGSAVSGGRHMPHGRHEVRLPRRVEVLTPEEIVVLRRGEPDRPPEVRPCPSGVVQRELVSSTYAAGELRRFWPFAAVLAAASPAGPDHPPVVDVAGAFANRLAACEVALPRVDGVRLSDVLAGVPTGELTAWSSGHGRDTAADASGGWEIGAAIEAPPRPALIAAEKTSR
jgi:hypothetical protein